jgi:hypothetical protein
MQDFDYILPVKEGTHGFRFDQEIDSFDYAPRIQALQL